MSWLMNNLGTIVVSLVLLAVVASVVRHMWKGKKQGKSSCGCDCSACGSCPSCHGR
jgi:cytochrome c553